METDETIPLTREEIITSEAAFRQKEVDDYQRNVEKYTTALQRIDMLYPEGHELRSKMQEFKAELQQRILDEKYQQARSNLILDACQVQLEQAKTEELKS